MVPQVSEARTALLQLTMGAQMRTQSFSETSAATQFGMPLGLRYVTLPFRFVARSVMEFVDINGLYLAAAIAYYSFMSMFPLALVLIWGSREIIGIERFDQHLIEGIESVVPVLTAAGGSSFIEDFILHAIATNNAVTLFSLVGLVFGALGVFGAIRKSMNEIWGVERYRPLVHQRLVDLMLMITASCVLFLSLMLALAFTFIEQIMAFMFPEVSQINPVLTSAVRWLAPLSLTWLAITVAYSWLPNVNVRLTEVMLVSACTTIAFELVKAGFIFYLQSVAPTIVSFYGSMTTTTLFFLFIYAQSIVLLVGAMFAVKRTLHRRALARSRSVVDSQASTRRGVDGDATVSISLKVPPFAGVVAH